MKATLADEERVEVAANAAGTIGQCAETSALGRELPFVTSSLKSTGLSASELERFYDKDVAPVCGRNLTSLRGGVWTGSTATGLPAPS